MATVSYTLRMDVDLRLKLDDEAKRQNVNPAALLQRLLWKGLGRSGVVQSVERGAHNAEVVSSSLTLATKLSGPAAPAKVSKMRIEGGA